MALNFPAKIYQILENESNEVIRWLNNGAAFRIVDHGRFEREIIPKYFRHNQISSVQRQLNLYGFKCISRGEDKGAFFHPKFRRGDWEVVKKIQRYAPLKKPDDKNDDPTKPDDLVSMSPPTLMEKATFMGGTGNPVGTSSSSTNTTNAAAATTSSSSNFPHHLNYPPHHLHSHHPAYYPPPPHHRPPYDPLYGNYDYETSTSANNAPSTNPNSHYSNSPPPPPAWLWNSGPSQYPHNPYAIHDYRHPGYPYNASSSNHHYPTKTVSTPSNQQQQKAPDSPKVSSFNQQQQQNNKAAIHDESASTAKITPAYINIINDVVLIDPDFDLDEDLDFLNEVESTTPSHLKPPSSDLQNKDYHSHNNNQGTTSSSNLSHNNQPKTRDIGINTDITFFSFYGGL